MGRMIVSLGRCKFFLLFKAVARTAAIIKTKDFLDKGSKSKYNKSLANYTALRGAECSKN